MLCDHELADELARCIGKNASYVKISLCSKCFRGVWELRNTKGGGGGGGVFGTPNQAGKQAFF